MTNNFVKSNILENEKKSFLPFGKLIFQNLKN